MSIQIFEPLSYPCLSDSMFPLSSDCLSPTLDLALLDTPLFTPFALSLRLFCCLAVCNIFFYSQSTSYTQNIYPFWSSRMSQPQNQNGHYFYGHSPSFYTCAGTEIWKTRLFSLNYFEQCCTIFLAQYRLTFYNVTVNFLSTHSISIKSNCICHLFASTTGFYQRLVFICSNVEFCFLIP